MLVNVGQVWKDNDRRAEGKRKLRVVRIFADDMVECAVIIGNKSTGRTTKIHTDRFKNATKGKGYTLVSEMKSSPPPNIPISFGG